MAVVLTALALLPGAASAQREDLFSVEACRLDPSSEECVCGDVTARRMVPKKTMYDSGHTLVGVSTDTDIRPIGPIYDPERRVWEGHPDDLEVGDNDKYKAHCSMSYFRENQRRLLYVVIAMAAGLTAVSVTWGGFVHMQESASGESRSMSRTVIIRACLGMLLLSMIFLAWDAVSSLYLGGLEIWDTAPGLLESF